MSIEAPARTGLSAGFQPPSAEVVITRRLIGGMWKITRWFWPVAVVITIVVTTTIARFTPITRSVWENAGQWPRWWLFAMAITLVVAHLPLVVMHGVTRQAAIRAVGFASVLISFAWSGFMVAGHVVEKLVFDRLGWPDTLDSPHLFTDGYDVLPMFAEYSLVFLAYITTGVLVGGVYYRFGAIRGTLLLTPALLPVVAIELLLSTGWVGSGLQDELSIGRPTAAVLIVASIVVLSFAALAIHLVLRDVPIQSKT